jgi:hypothetical protein
LSGRPRPAAFVIRHCRKAQLNQRFDCSKYNSAHLNNVNMLNLCGKVQYSC